MAKQYVSESEIDQIARAMVDAGYTGDDFQRRTRRVVEWVSEQRRSEEFLESSVPKQLAKSFQRSYQAWGSMLGTIPGGLISLVAGRPSGIKSPIEVAAQTIAEPFKEIPAPVTEQAPAAAKVIAPIAGTLMRDIPLLVGGAGLVGKAVSLGQKGAAAGILGKAAKPLYTTASRLPRIFHLAQNAALFEALNQAEGGEPGQGAAMGVALSVVPLAMRSLPQFTPPVLPGGVLNMRALPAPIQRLGFGAGALTGLTTKELLEGRSIREQFDARSPEGQASLMSKGLAFGFTTLTGMKQSMRLQRLRKAVIEETDRAALEMLGKRVKPEVYAFRKAMSESEVRMTPEDVHKMFARTNDVALRKLAKQFDVKVKPTLMSEQEIGRIREARGDLAALNEAQPNRSVFKDQTSRDIVLKDVMVKMASGGPAAEASLRRETKAGEIMFKLVRQDVNNIPKSTMKKGLTPEQDPVTQMQKAYAGRLGKYFEEDISKYYTEVVAPRPTREAWRHRSILATFGTERGEGLYKKMALGKKRLSDLVSGNEYAQYLKVSKGEGARFIRELEGEVVRRTGVVRPVGEILQNRWVTEFPGELKELAPRDRKPMDFTWTHYVRKYGMAAMRHQDAFPGDPVGTMYYSLSNAHTKSLDWVRDISAMDKAIWRAELPARASGPRWKALRQYIWQRANPKAAAVAGIKARPLADVAKEIGWTGDLKQLAARGKHAWNRQHLLYDWMFAQSGLPFARHHESYFPLLFKWYKAGMPGTLNEFLVKNKISPANAKDFTSLIRQLAEPPIEKVALKARPSYEYPRAEKDFVRSLVFEDDPIVALRRYSQAMARRTIKQPLLPLVEETIQRIRLNHPGEPGIVKRLEKSLRWYLEGWWGMPTPIDRYFEGVHPFATGLEWMTDRVPGLKPTMAKIKSGAKRVPGVRRLVTTPAQRDAGTLRDFFDFMTTSAYGATMAFRINPPLKNLIQSSHNIVIHGPKVWAQGQAKLLTDPAFRARIKRFHKAARIQFLDMPEEGMGAVRKMTQDLTRAGLLMFRGADTVNVYGALAGGDILLNQGWKTLTGPKRTWSKDVFLDKLKLRRMPFRDRVLGKFRHSPILDPHYKKTWRGSETLGNEIWKDVLQGNRARAEMEYMKMSAWLGQWAYGSPEAPPMFRGSLNRLLFMYKSWPLHYAEFLTAMASHRTGREWLRLMGSWMGVGATAKYLGLPFWKWIASGPFPRDPTEAPPSVDVALLPYKMAKALSEGSQEWLFADEDDIWVATPEERIQRVLQEFSGDYIKPWRKEIDRISGERPVF